MNKKLFLLLTGSAIAFFFACSGEVVESTESSRAKLALTVTVQDIVSGELLEADVSLNNGVPLQAKSGVAVFGDVTTGTHNLLAKIEGYADMISQIDVDPVLGQNAQIPRDYSANIKLYPLTSALWGYLRYTDENGVVKPVPANIEVKLKLNDIYNNNTDYEDVFVNKLYTAKTDANGKYAFDFLPAVGNNYSIWVQEATIGNIDYRSTTLNRTPLQTSGTVYAGEKILSEDLQTNLFVVSEYPSIIEYADIDKPIKFKFTEAVDRNRVNSSSIAIINSTANIAWNADNTELTLTPMGNWAGLTAVYLGLQSISGRVLEDNYYYINVLLADLSAEAIEPALLTDPAKIDYNSAIYFKYSKVPGATSYAVYTNNNNEGIYTRNTNVSGLIETEDDFTVYLPSLNLFREVGILVQATNGNSKTQLDTAKAIKVKDVVKPTYNGATEYIGATVAGVNDTLYLNLDRTSYFGTTTTTLSGTINFSEPIQVDDVELQLVNAGGNAIAFGRASVERVWSTNNSSISYRITITGSATALPGNLDARLLIKNIKDLTGNPFEIQYINSAGTAIGDKKDRVAIRFYTEI